MLEVHQLLFVKISVREDHDISIKMMNASARKKLRNLENASRWNSKEGGKNLPTNESILWKWEDFIYRLGAWMKLGRLVNYGGHFFLPFIPIWRHLLGLLRFSRGGRRRLNFSWPRANSLGWNKTPTSESRMASSTSQFEALLSFLFPRRENNDGPRKVGMYFEPLGKRAFLSIISDMFWRPTFPFVTRGFGFWGCCGN